MSTQHGAPNGPLDPTAPVRVAIAAVGDPTSPGTWSGVAAGVFGGLRELGVATSTLDLKLPRGLEQMLLVLGAAPTRNRFDAEGAALPVAVRTALARRRLIGAQLDGIVQIGSSFKLPPGVPYVTLEDMTVRQGRVIHPVFSRMSPRGITGWEARRKQIYGGARMCATASQWTAQSLLVDYGVPSDRVGVVGFGATHRADAVDERGWEQPRFLFVGIDWERKGGPLLLRAFARLREQLPQATLDVVGGHPPIELAGVHAHGVLSQTHAGDRERILELFARCTCLVVPSHVEPFGIVYVEAGSAGMPSILTSEGGARDTIGADGGLVVEPGDEDGLLAAMLQISDPTVAQRMGEAARARAGLYTWRKVAERLLRALGLPSPDGGKLAELL
jgi:glycosyltransferase involved in cell wall biosynthesis